MEKQNNFVRALLFGMVISVLGAVVFGIFLYKKVALNWQWGSITLILLAGLFFLIPIKKPKIYHVLIAVIWCAVWYFVFNFVAILMCETVFVINNMGLSFKEAFLKVLELWKSNNLTKLFFESNLTTLMWYTVNGSVINLVFVTLICVIKVIKNKNENKNTCVTEVRNNQPEVFMADSNFFGEQEAEYIKIYKRVISLCKQALLEYNEDNDKQLLNRKIEKVKNEIILNQSLATRQLIETYAQKELSKNLMKLDRHANEIVVDIA